MMSRPLVAGILWFILAVWAATILYLSSLTPQELPDSLMFDWDKFNHFIAFAVGGWFAATAMQVSLPRTALKWKILGAIVLIAVFGAVDEMRQLLTPGRSGADFYDWLADFIGAIAGAIFSLLTHDFLERRTITRP